MADEELLLSELSAQPGVLSPGFSPQRRQYCLRVTHADEAVRIAARSLREDAELVAAGQLVAAGSASLPVPVAPGSQDLVVEVRAPGARQGTRYTVTVVRGHRAPDWVQVAGECPFAPRDSAGELVFGGRLWLIGGYLPELVSDVWSSPDGVTWLHEGQLPAPEDPSVRQQRDRQLDHSEHLPRRRARPGQTLG